MTPTTLTNETEPRPAAPAASASHPQQTVTELVSGIITDAQRLAREQFDMLKAEFHEDLHRTKQALQFSALGIVMLTVGGISAVFGLVYALHEHWQFSMWASWAIIGALFLAAGIAFAVLGRRLFESFNPLPDKTFNALQENLTWIVQPQK